MVSRSIAAGRSRKMGRKLKKEGMRESGGEKRGDNAYRREEKKTFA